MKGWDVRCIANRYESPEIAWEHWSKGTLWGNPIWLRGKIHVYGVYKRNWTPVMVEFAAKRIIVARVKT